MATINNNKAIHNFTVRWLFSTNHKDIGTLYLIFVLSICIIAIIVFPIKYLNCGNLYMIEFFLFVRLFAFLLTGFLSFSLKLRSIYDTYFHLTIFYFYLPLLKLFYIIQLLFIFSYILIGCLNLSIFFLNVLAPLLTIICKSGPFDLNTIYCADSQSLSEEENSSLSLHSVDTENHASDNNVEEIDHKKALLSISKNLEAQLQYVSQNIIFPEFPDLRDLLSDEDLRYVFLDRGPNLVANLDILGYGQGFIRHNEWFNTDGVDVFGYQPWPSPSDPKLDRIRAIIDRSLDSEHAYNVNELLEEWETVYQEQFCTPNSEDILSSANKKLSQQNFEIIRDLWKINYVSEQQRVADFERVFNRLSDIFSSLRQNRYNECYFWDPFSQGERDQMDGQVEALKRFSNIFLQQGPNPSRQLALLDKTFFPYSKNLNFNWTELRQALFLEEGFIKRQAFDKLQTVLDEQVFSSIYERYPDTGGYALAWVLEVWLGVLKQQRQPTTDQIYVQLNLALCERFSLSEEALNDLAYTPQKVKELNSFLNKLSQLQRNFQEDPNQNNTGLKTQGLAILHHKVDSESHPELADILKRLTEVFPTKKIASQQQIIPVENVDSLSEILRHSGIIDNEYTEIEALLQRLPPNYLDESQIMNHLEHGLSLQVKANPFHQWALLEETFFPLVPDLSSSEIRQALFSTGTVANRKLEELCQTLHVEDLTPSTQVLKQVLQTWKKVLSQQQEKKC